jgi:hypothetical protein
MDYSATWLFTNSYSSKNSRNNLRPVASREFTRFLNLAGGRPLPSAPAPHLQPLHDALHNAPDHAVVSVVLEQLTAQLLEVFDQVRLERDATPRASADWQKLTGELLAYARVTALLENMKCGSPSAFFSEE